MSIVRDHESFSSAVIKSDARPPYPPLDDDGLTMLDEVRRFRGAQLVEQDPPRHGDMRRLLHQYFTASAIEKWRPFIRSAVARAARRARVRRDDQCHDGARGSAAGSRDRASHGRAGNGSRAAQRISDKLLYINRGEPNRFTTLVEGIRGILDCMAPLAERRLYEPGRDFISVLAEGERIRVMDRYELLVNCALLLFAGHETTVNLIRERHPRAHS